MKRALILFGHGSRDTRWAGPFLRLQEMLRAQLPDVAVELAYLDLLEPRLPDLIDRLAAESIAAVTVVPVFFGQGGHVLRDVPLLVEEARAKHSAMQISLAKAVGESDSVLRAIAVYCSDFLQLSPLPRAGEGRVDT
ncbi:MAG TPA: CbiX/SirB N-terminal domain-containing protein [Burkholderiaceae bacterium]